jgi:hypothetical protein
MELVQQFPFALCVAVIDAALNTTICVRAGCVPAAAAFPDNDSAAAAANNMANRFMIDDVSRRRRSGPFDGREKPACFWGER